MRSILGFTNRLVGFPATLCLALACAATVLPAPSAHAQEIQITGPLAGQPAVRGMRMYRVDRLQLIVPALGFTLQDEFSRSLMTGLEANYHFTDYLGIGVYGAAANFGNSIRIDSDLTTQIIANGQTTGTNRLSMPDEANFGDQIARLQGLASLHLLFAPLRGKLSLFQGAFVDTDFYVMAGVALAFVEERAQNFTEAADGTRVATGVCDAANNQACLDSQTARESRIAIAPMLGVGLNLYFNSYLGLALQWRAFPFAMNPAGFDDGGGTAESSVPVPDGMLDDRDHRFYFHHMVNVGLIINLPPESQVSE